jgi:hypothetical protein
VYQDASTAPKKAAQCQQGQGAAALACRRTSYKCDVTVHFLILDPNHSKSIGSGMDQWAPWN